MENMLLRIQNLVGEDCGIPHAVSFELGDQRIVVDGREVPNYVGGDDRAVECQIHISLENAIKLLNGQLNVMNALLFGQLKIKGDMSIAMKVASFIQSKKSSQ